MNFNHVLGDAVAESLGSINVLLKL
ncbi:protein of unknown function [Shewanella benthica]|uniref:Uncharacterized protein n=1 Tax=Shewanella benthica TaxID=43661 RepID=A0A330LYT7_9GAMM|nr:protein of unknown function [Shewanella benthica]